MSVSKSAASTHETFSALAGQDQVLASSGDISHISSGKSCNLDSSKTTVWWNRDFFRGCRGSLKHPSVSSSCSSSIGREVRFPGVHPHSPKVSLGDTVCQTPKDHFSDDNISTIISEGTPESLPQVHVSSWIQPPSSVSAPRLSVPEPNGITFMDNSNDFGSSSPTAIPRPHSPLITSPSSQPTRSQLSQRQRKFISPSHGIENKRGTSPRTSQWKSPRGISGIVEPHNLLAVSGDFPYCNVSPPIICSMNETPRRTVKDIFSLVITKVFRSTRSPRRSQVLGPQRPSSTARFQTSPELEYFTELDNLRIAGDWTVREGFVKCMSSTRIYPALNRRSGKVYVIKSTKASLDIPWKQATYILNEWKVLEILRNKKKFKRSFLLSPSQDVDLWAWKDRIALYHVTDICIGGDLLSLVGSLEGDQLRLAAAEIALGLEALHSLNIVHHDVKPSNIFIHQDGHIRLSDFGGSQFKPPGRRLSRRQSELDLIADSDYWAPEMFVYDGCNIAYYDEGIDYYSFGATLFHLITGEVLYPNLDYAGKVNCARRGPVDAWRRLRGSADLRDFVVQLLIVNPSHRLKGKSVRNHPYFATFKGRWKSMKQAKHTGPFVNHDFKASLQRLFNPVPKETSIVTLSTSARTTESNHLTRQEMYPSSPSSSTSGYMLQHPSIPDQETYSIPISGSSTPVNLAQTEFSSYILPPQIDNHSYYRQSIPVIPQKFMRQFPQYSRSLHTSAASDLPPPPSTLSPQRYRYPNYNHALPPTDLRTLFVLQGLDLIHWDVFETVHE